MENSLPKNILELSISERIQLVQDIWDSVAMNTQEIPVTDTQKQELDRRLTLWQQNPEQVSRWEDIKEKFK